VARAEDEDEEDKEADEGEAAGSAGEVAGETPPAPAPVAAVAANAGGEGEADDDGAFGGGGGGMSDGGDVPAANALTIRGGLLLLTPLPLVLVLGAEVMVPLPSVTAIDAAVCGGAVELPPPLGDTPSSCLRLRLGDDEEPTTVSMTIGEGAPPLMLGTAAAALATVAATGEAAGEPVLSISIGDDDNGIA